MTSGRIQWGLAVALGAAVAALAVFADRHDCRAGVGLPIHSCRWPVLHTSPGNTEPLEQLRWHPLDGTSYRQLAEIRAGEGGGAASASPLWAIAYRRAPRDPKLAEADMRNALGAGNWASAAAALDRRLRLDPEAAPDVLNAWFETMGARTPASATALGTLLARDPPWRPWLLQALTRTTVAAPVLDAALSAGADLTHGELEVLVTSLVDAGDPVGARQRWLSSLGDGAGAADDGSLFDPEFSGVAAPPPFAWEIQPAPGVSVEMEGGLVVSFAGRPADFTGVSQQLALAPGSYRLEVDWSSGLRGNRPVAWVLLCVSPESELARISMFPASPSRGQQSASPFAVPPTCPRQRLQLVAISRNLAQRGLEGELRVQRVRVERAVSHEREESGAGS